MTAYHRLIISDDAGHQWAVGRVRHRQGPCYIRARDAARVLGVDPRTVRRYIRQGILHAVPSAAARRYHDERPRKTNNVGYYFIPVDSWEDFLVRFRSGQIPRSPPRSKKK